LLNKIFLNKKPPKGNLLAVFCLEFIFAVATLAVRLVWRDFAATHDVFFVEFFLGFRAFEL